MSKYSIANHNRIFAQLLILIMLLVGGCKSGVPKAPPGPVLVPPMPQAAAPVVEEPCQPIQPAQPSKMPAEKLVETPKVEAPKVETPKSVIPSPLGLMGWHAAEPNALAKQVEGFFQRADVQASDDIIALISPHAGYAYSGQTAAFGVKAAKTKYKRIIVIGPSHQVPMLDVLSVPGAVTHYQTPLGEIPLDAEFINKLLQSPLFKDIPQAYRTEHSVLIQLPLLQYHFGDFKLVPIVAGQCSQATVQQAASILKSLVDSNTLVVASSDFTHYGPTYDYVPFSQNIPEGLKKLDMGAYDYISKLDSTGFSQYCDKTGATICGRVPIAILLSMLPSGTKPELLKYTTSGELTGDFTNSVSYLSVAFHGDWQKQTAIAPAKTDNSLTDKDKQNLLLLARKTIEFYLQNHRVPSPEQLDISLTEAMKISRAAFVTLKEHSELRGCIGEIYPRQPLYKSVIANAVNAAVNDWRFGPVTRNELAKIKIEISALTVPVPIDSYNKIRLGTDGIILRKGGHSALFLPQVATEQRWDIPTMLTELSLKAGLPADAWKEGATFFVFQAEVFGEEK
ncbi:MAG: AmmeMemoRadiSam system protein B [Sedimentisphaerales bacterium]|jgi:AmmeMemoRadiSam system protein B/AmmeMemoRadiSam system protein A